MQSSSCILSRPLSCCAAQTHTEQTGPWPRATPHILQNTRRRPPERQLGHTHLGRRWGAARQRARAPG